MLGVVLRCLDRGLEGAGNRDTRHGLGHGGPGAELRGRIVLREVLLLLLLLLVLLLLNGELLRESVDVRGSVGLLEGGKLSLRRGVLNRLRKFRLLDVLLGRAAHLVLLLRHVGPAVGPVLVHLLGLVRGLLRWLEELLGLRVLEVLSLLKALLLLLQGLLQTVQLLLRL